MSIFNEYLKDLPTPERRGLERIILLVRKYVEDAEEGWSYGLPAFKWRGRPLIGFSSNKYGLNIYPFDPRVITAIKSELDGFEVGKGVIRFTSAHPLPDEVVILIVDLRLEYLRNSSDD